MKCDELLYFTRRGRQSLHILSTVNVSGIVFFTQIYYIPIPVINTVFDLKIRITVLNRISPNSLTGVCIFNNTLRSSNQTKSDAKDTRGCTIIDCKSVTTDGDKTKSLFIYGNVI